jgi:Cd2+/Zn2+-exporting ATPase
MVLLLVAVYLDNFLKPEWFTGLVRIVWYVVAYIPVGFPVIKEALKALPKARYFRISV